MLIIIIIQAIIKIILNMPLNKWAAFYKENSVDIIYYYSQKSHNKRILIMYLILLYIYKIIINIIINI